MYVFIGKPDNSREDIRPSYLDTTSHEFGRIFILLRIVQKRPSTPVGVLTVFCVLGVGHAFLCSFSAMTERCVIS